MLSILKNKTYARLFAAQVIAVVGTGLMTIALGLLAYDLAGDRAGVVLGTAYAIKMIAYVGLAPIASALVDRLPRRAVLICADLVRASVVLALPFIDAIWQIYVLIFILQAASATFTPSFQAAIPDILPDEQDYIRALSLSRLAYDLENLISPALAGLLLAVMSYHWLFTGTVVGFLASALLVFSTTIPSIAARQKSRPFMERLTRGTRIYLATPRLRGLLSLNMAAAAISGFVLVNTVVIVRSGYGLDQTALAYALAAFGGGSMVAALSLPRLLEKLNDRSVMVWAAVVLVVLSCGHAFYLITNGLPTWSIFLVIWAVSGGLYSAILTPSGNLLRRSSHAEDRPALFAAQFALSHTTWLISYPVAGWAGDAFGMGVAMAILGGMALISVIVAVIVWPAGSGAELEHEHPDLPADHPHFKENKGGTAHHAHVFVIDDEHRGWPVRG